MKNKEIEELLNELKRRNERYNYCKNNDISFSDEDYKSYLLLSYIEQLENNRDKAINLLSDLEIQPAYLDCKYYELYGFNELKDILKGGSDE